MKISVITPCFNSEATLRETIESVLAQRGVELEHIVIDGGSQDGTLPMLRGYPHLRWFTGEDRGLFDAMNKGIRLATGELIVILNADDCFREGALAAALTAFEANPDWDASFADFLFVDRDGTEIMRRAEAVYDFKVLLYGLDYICHHTMFVRKSVYERLGGYRFEEYPWAADYEFKLRLGRARCRVGHVPRFMVNYRIHARQVSAVRAQAALEEVARIRREYGNSGGLSGRVWQVCFKVKRQLQKIFLRGRCDLIPGGWRLHKHRSTGAQCLPKPGMDNQEP